MSEISKTGFWSGNTAHNHHVHCANLANWIANYLNDYKDSPLYDFGCGMGDYLSAFKSAGFNQLTGFEGDPPVQRRFDNIKQQDLSKPFTVDQQGNCLFLEVAEHVPAEFESIVLDNVTAACNNKLIMSWAIVGQAGFGHVNCLDNDDAIKRITDRGFVYLKEDSEAARSINLDVAPWFKNTILIFQKK